MYYGTAKAKKEGSDEMEDAAETTEDAAETAREGSPVVALSPAEVPSLKVPQLKEIAESLGIQNFKNLKKKQLVTKIQAALAK